jgi:hypothetical protein
VTKVIVKQLREKAFRTETYELFNSAADRIEKLEAALRSIAANKCCDGCREAALVAHRALEGKND